MHTTDIDLGEGEVDGEEGRVGGGGGGGGEERWRGKGEDHSKGP